MKIYKIKYSCDGFVINKIVCAENEKEAEKIIIDYHYYCWCYIDFIEIKEIELTKGIIDLGFINI